MKNLLSIVLMIAVWVLLLCCVSARAVDLDLTWSAGFVPPHNEPVVGNKVARYRTTIGAELTQGWFYLNPELTFWHVNTWTPANTHVTSSWEHDDWSIEGTRPTLDLNLEIGPETMPHLYSEYFAPLGNWSQRGAGSFSSYWWIIGIKGRLGVL